jgi:hypothetical protein
MPARAREKDLIKDAVDASFGLPSRQVAMVSWDGRSVDALALMSRARSTLSFKTTFRLTDFHPVCAVSFDSLVKRISTAHRETFDALRRQGGSLSAEIAVELKRLFDGEQEGPWTVLEKLAAAAPAELWPEDRAPVVAYEREVVGLALSAAGMDRDPVMKRWSGDTEAPFLASLSGLVALEPAIIAHDARVFGEWRIIADGIVGATRFEQRGGRKLTVLNVNHSKVERALGCDLIYYTHRYDAYVLVQYKRLRRGGSEWEYRPDAQLDKELERMRRITAAAKPSSDPASHRLGADFCFVKLCLPEVEDPFSMEMAEGMYLPLGLVDKLRDSEQVRGPRGGKAFTYENVDRHLTNTNMIGLIARSWLGSCGATSEQIGEVIRSALAAGSSMILASDANPRPARVARSRGR